MFPVEIWGTVGQWASGLASSGALLLGFYIMLRDRRAREREQAAKLSCWYSLRREYGCTTVEIHVRNNSDNDFYSLIPSVMDFSDEVDLSADNISYGILANRLPPQEEKSLDMPLEVSRPAQDLLISISFKDVNGVTWSRDLKSMRISKDSPLPFWQKVYLRWHEHHD